MLGKMGSGKTACMVREIVRNDDLKKTYTNIILKGVEKDVVKTINRDMIFTEKVVRVKKNGSEETKKVLNADFWKGERSENPDGINVVLDEAHTLIDSRRAMSNDNVVMNDFMALLRRILGDSGSDYGELVLITQLGRRLDVNARELATSVHYHKAHFFTRCFDCGYGLWEHNELYQKMHRCPWCGSRKWHRESIFIEKWEFDGMESFELWSEYGRRTYEKHYYITDIADYFRYYDTFQWENLISEY